MPPSPVLTAASTVTCAPGHLGAGLITITPSPRLTVGGPGQGVLTMDAAATATTAGCTQPVGTPPPPKPCTIAKVTSGAAVRLTVDGSPVLLSPTFAATTDGLPTAVFAVTPGHALLTAE